MYVNSLGVKAIPRNSKIFYITVKSFEILSNYSLFLHASITFHCEQKGSNIMLSKKKDLLLLWYTLLSFKYIFKLQRKIF